MSAETEAPPPKAARDVAIFVSRRAVVTWVSVGVLGSVLYLFDGNGVGALGGLLALFAAQAAVSFALGVRLGKERIDTPWAPWAQAPLLVVWRRSLALPLLRDMTYLGQFMGSDSVRLSAQEGEFATLFDSRDRRHAFFAEVRRRQPAVEIYRDAGPEE